MHAFSVDQLKLAFGYELVSRIIGTDGAVTPEESVFIERASSPGALVGAGFVDGNGGFLPRYREAVAESLRQLPKLDVADRLDLVECIVEAAAIDGVFPAKEAEAIAHAARMLGLLTDEVASRLN